jgi:hypothetical protein
MKVVAWASNPARKLGFGREMPIERRFSALCRMNTSHDHIDIT